MVAASANLDSGRTHRSWHHWESVAVAVVMAAATLTLFAAEAMAEAGLVVLDAAYLLTGLLFISRARKFQGRERLAWSLFGGALLAAFVGISTGVSIGIATGTVPAVSVADVFFLSSYVGTIAALVVFPQGFGDTARRFRLLIDGLVGAVSVGAMLWVLVLGPLLNGPQLEWWVNAVLFSYPALDAVIIGMVTIVLVRRSIHRFDRRLLLLGLGLVIQSGADLSHIANAEPGATIQPNTGALLLAVAALLLTAINLNHRPTVREYADRRLATWPLFIPYAAAAVMVWLLLDHLVKSVLAPDTIALVVGTLVVVVFVFLRQVISIREHRAADEEHRRALVSSISHELRTPLTAIVGFLDVLNSDYDLGEGERRELSSIAQSQATYMSRIVADLILLARGHLDNVSLKEGRVSVESLLETAVRGVDLSGKQLTVQCPPGLGIEADPDRMQQVLVNLLTNAARYGGSKIILRAEASGHSVTFEVHDDGPGVPKKYEIRVWERFERGANRLNAVTPGSGIGLAVVDAIARAHRGRAEYRRSERLGGACFAVSLPGRARVSTGGQLPPATISLNGEN
jgi:signal transduction histidine kinase